MVVLTRIHSAPLVVRCSVEFDVELEVGRRPVWMIADTGMKGIVFYQEKLDSIAACKVGQQIVT